MMPIGCAELCWYDDDDAGYDDSGYNDYYVDGDNDVDDDDYIV